MSSAVKQKTRQINPFALIKRVWPDITLYQQQKEIIKSVWFNRETIVPAGNMLGKDYVAALVALVFFLTRKEARVVSTSVDAPQLEKVLWGEMKRLINTASIELPLKVNHLDIRKLDNKGNEIDMTYLIGRTAKEPEGLLGHHLPWGGENNDIPSTLMLYDEASSIPDELFDVTETWRHRMLAIGNCYPTTNYFYRSSEEGNNPTPSGKGIFRNVIRIKAVDSPNVRLAMNQVAAGEEPTNEVLIQGLKTWNEYQLNLKTWDEAKQCVSLDARFWKGSDVRMFSEHMLNLSLAYARELEEGMVKRKATAIGCDPAEGGDDTCWAVTDEHGLIELISLKTSKTSIIADMTIQLMRQHGVEAYNVMFDRGGGGKQHADYLAKMGYPVRTIGFGGNISLEVKLTAETFYSRKEVSEERTEYADNRSMMYGMLRDRMNPDYGNRFGVPARYATGQNNSGIFDQIKLIPLLYNDRMKLKLIRKARQGANARNRKPTDEPTFMDLINRSPDQTDALVMANYIVFERRTTRMPGAY